MRCVSGTPASSTWTTRGGGQVCAVIAGGAVACWGDDSYGQLGSDVPNGESATPVLVPGIQGATSVAAGDLATCWGANDDGQLGTGNTTDSYTPAIVQ